MSPDEMLSKAESAGDMTRERMIAHLRAANEVARDAVVHGHHPFGAVLVGPDDRILMRQGNIDTVRHAETELARRAAAAYLPEFLWTCTLVSTGESCAMCTGTLYWANIGRLVYGYEETKLLALTGDHPQNPDDEPRRPHGARFGPEKDRGARTFPRTRGRAARPAPGLLETRAEGLKVVPKCPVVTASRRVAGTVNLAQAERRRSAVVEYHADAVAATQVAMASVRR